VHVPAFCGSANGLQPRGAPGAVLTSTQDVRCLPRVGPKTAGHGHAVDSRCTYTLATRRLSSPGLRTLPAAWLKGALMHNGQVQQCPATLYSCTNSWLHQDCSTGLHSGCCAMCMSPTPVHDLELLNVLEHAWLHFCPCHDPRGAD
jgi:hypothetical protein